jgi:1,4-alpha-glucan branching enzyme
MVDADNLRQEEDGQGNTNSVYYKPNFLFQFKGATTASKAYVTGSFNQWKQNELAMYKTGSGWALPIYLAAGTHTYKFLIDGVYYNEAGKMDKLPDGKGGYNSVARLGKPYVFSLVGYTNAGQVTVAGTFNNWRPNELHMQKNSLGWELPYALAAGNYQYKFVVDGNWIRDPANPLTATLGGQINSFLMVGANYTFRLKAPANARSVFVAGDFNSWEPTTLAMKRQGDEWNLSVYLSPGKHKYKFVVDGKWILDPANKTWEQNEFGTGNSIVWIEN